MINIDERIENADWPKRRARLYLGEPVVLGDVEGHEFHGNQWTTEGASLNEPSTKAKEAKAVEVKHQQELAAKQTNPLAHPLFVLGMENAISNEHERYVAAYGEEFKGIPLPDDVERGTIKECYKNASLLVMMRPDLTYVEGFAKSARTGDLSFLHAWAVDKQGNVIDPTWPTPDKNQYFGVKYDREKYLQYLYKAKLYGVLGSTFKNAMNAIDTGGKKLR